ncbi:pectinesterase inhibitor-like [Pyrus ussuriensis x Pyrus communis]|uniref:Pectinesterase inhibitor-like n=1 Tax=Pyrus ussuriensis x Pyrus communis TaxID=2448454 RepID=A0A5N5IJ99_9ROSA|nr:pectinesterase inhibitor-like [Pyrus ussuriensis x Pyrus communis]
MIKSSKETKAIQQCAQSYGSVASCFRGTQDEVKEEDSMANYTVARVSDDIGVCEKALSSDGVKLPTTISTRLQLVKLYNYIGYTITIQLLSIWLHH